MTTYIYKVEIQIEASSLEEAEAIYAAGDWCVDGHEVFMYDSNGYEVLAS